MYNLPYVKAEDESVLPFLEKYPFAILCAAGNEGRVQATHLPLLIEKKEESFRLFGHIMKGTPHYEIFTSAKEVLAIFSGPDHFISSSWYPGELTASTWNYMTIHVRGQIQFTGDAELISMLQKLTDHFEKEDSNRRFKHLPGDYVAELLPYIAGFYINVTNVETVFKLSQREDENVYQSIIHHLEQEKDQNAGLIAEEMRKRMPALFSK